MKIQAWATFDTDGNRTPPKILLPTIRHSEQAAIACRAYKGLDPLYYPIQQITIEWSDESPIKTTIRRIAPQPDPDAVAA
jgi:hypothetical protein